MKGISTVLLAIILLTFNTQTKAQRVKVVTEKRAKVAVRKAKRDRVRVRSANRQRVKRTRAVHFHYRHLPKRGAVVTAINRNALPVRWKGIGFRYHSGIWYKPYQSKWVITRPMLGMRVAVLPAGYRRIVLGSKQYFYYYGTYYVKRNEEYQVVDAPMGAEVDSLPEGYDTVKLAGQEYYELDGVYYMPSTDENGEEILVVIDEPGSTKM